MNSFTHGVDGQLLDDATRKFVYSQFLNRVESLSKRNTSREVISGFKAVYKNLDIISEDDTRRVFIRVNDLLIKIQRSTTFFVENNAEIDMWYRAKGTEYEHLLNPITYASENSRILVMPFLICLSASTPEYLEFEKQMSRDHDLYLTYPQGTDISLKRIVHYPYTREYPRGLLMSTVHAV